MDRLTCSMPSNPNCIPVKPIKRHVRARQISKVPFPMDNHHHLQQGGLLGLNGSSGTDGTCKVEVGASVESNRRLPKFTSYVDLSSQQMLEQIGTGMATQAASSGSLNFANLGTKQSTLAPGAAAAAAAAVGGRRVGGGPTAQFHSPPRHQLGRDGLSPLREMIRKL